MSNCPQCACESEQFGNCPNDPTWAVAIGDKDLFLCERCYRNVRDGAYPGVKIEAAFELPRRRDEPK